MGNKLPIVGCQPNETPELRGSSRSGPVNNSTDLGRVSTHTIVGNDVTKEADTLFKELTLLGMELEVSTL